MKIILVLVVAWVGYVAGKSDWRVKPALVLVTVLLAGIGHGLVRAVLPHEAIDAFASKTPYAILLIPVAALETIGISVPVLALPWGTPGTRTAMSLFIVGAASIGALTFYHPLDVVMINDVVVGPTHPPYVVSLVFSLAFAALPFVIGLVERRRQRPRAS